VTLPRRSQIAPPSPSVNFDEIPSPRRRKSTIGVNYDHTPASSGVRASARKTVTVIHSPPPDDMDLGGDELEEAMISQSMLVTSKKRVRATTRNGNADGDEDADEGDGEGVEMGRNTDARLSMASRKSASGAGIVDPDADTDDEEIGGGGGPSFRFEGNTTVDPDLGMDVMDQGGDDYAGMEEAAVAAEEESVEEVEEAEEGDEGSAAPKPPKKRPMPTAKKGRKMADPPPARVLQKKRRTRISGLENGM